MPSSLVYGLYTSLGLLTICDTPEKQQALTQTLEEDFTRVCVSYTCPDNCSCAINDQVEPRPATLTCATDTMSIGCSVLLHHKVFPQVMREAGIEGVKTERTTTYDFTNMYTSYISFMREMMPLK